MSEMQGRRVVPWASWEEWTEIRDMLSCGDVTGATGRMTRYRVRRPTATPLTMQASVSLVAQLTHPLPDPYTQRLALAMMLTRLVNGATDRLQPRGGAAAARSVYGLAGELGLPLGLVEVRHQASHNALPRGEALVSAAKQALLWLEHAYWVPQKAAADRAEEAQPVHLAQLQATFEGTDVAEVQWKREGNEEGDALSTMKTLIRGMKSTLGGAACEPKPSRKVQMPVEGMRRKRRWASCGQCEIWKRLPLGLAPGQTVVPASQSPAVPYAMHTETEEDRDEKMNDSSRDPAHSPFAPQDSRRDVPDPPRAKKLRVQSQKERDYIEKMRSEFKHVADATRQQAEQALNLQTEKS